MSLQKLPSDLNSAVAGGSHVRGVGVGRRLGFTMVEFLVVLAIILLLAAITYPLAMKSKMQSKVTASLSHMRQLHAAVSLYRSDNGGDGVYGTQEAMGLPMPPINPKLSPYGYTDALMRSPCGLHPDLAPSGSDPEIVVAYAFYRDWAKLTTQYGERVALFFDANCNNASMRLGNALEIKRGNAVKLDGSALSRVSTGSISSPLFFIDIADRQSEQPLRASL